VSIALVVNGILYVRMKSPGKPYEEPRGVSRVLGMTYVPMMLVVSSKTDTRHT
jgi:hypothetical protein